jgi:hypothetical protein
MEMRLSLSSISKTTIKRKLKNLFTLSGREAVVSKIIYNAPLSNESLGQIILLQHHVTRVTNYADEIRKSQSMTDTFEINFTSGSQTKEQRLAS